MFFLRVPGNWPRCWPLHRLEASKSSYTAEQIQGSWTTYKILPAGVGGRRWLLFFFFFFFFFRVVFFFLVKFFLFFPGCLFFGLRGEEVFSVGLVVVDVCFGGAIVG